MKHTLASRLILIALVAVVLLAAGCGGGGGGVSSSGGTGGGGNGDGNNQPQTTTTVTLRGRVNVPPAADPSFFASRAADKAGPDERGYVPLIGASVTVEGGSAVATTDSRGTFTLTLTYTGSSVEYPLKVTLAKDMIVLKKYVTEAAAGLPFQVTPQTTAAALVYDRLTGQGATGLDPDDMEQSAYKYTSIPLANVANAISNLLESGEVVTLTSPITEQGDVLVPLGNANDVTPPVLDNVALYASTVNGGDTLTVTVYVQDESGMSDNSSIQLNRGYSKISSAALQNWQYLSTSRLWRASANIDIPEYVSTGTCYVSLNLKDTLSNYIYLYSSQNPDIYPSSDFNFETSDKLPSLTIASALTDSTAPTLVSLEASDTTIDSAGDTAVLRLTVFDAESGISYANIRFTEQAGGSYAYGNCGGFSPGSEPGEYTCDITMNSSYFGATGTYKIDQITLIDNANNYKSYYGADLENPPEITVSYLPFTDPGTFSIINAAVVPATPSPGSTVSVSLSLNADRKPSFVALSYSNSKNFSLSTTSSSADGPWTYIGSTTLDPYVATGTYAPSSAYLSGYSQTDDGPWYKYFSSADPDDQDFLGQLPSFSVQSNPHADSDAPVLSLFQLKDTSFVRGGQFKATATVTDTGYPAYILFTIEQSDDEHYYYYNMRSYNVFPGTSAGEWVFEINETLPSNLAAGTWQVRRFYVYDLAGNWDSDSFINTSFTLY